MRQPGYSGLAEWSSSARMPSQMWRGSIAEMMHRWPPLLQRAIESTPQGCSGLRVRR
jgi:hypothetical protein